MPSINCWPVATLPIKVIVLWSFILGGLFCLPAKALPEHTYTRHSDPSLHSLAQSLEF